MMATYYKRLTAHDGADNLRKLMRAFETLYGAYDAYLRGGNVWETDYYNRQAIEIRLESSTILGGEAKVLSVSQRVMHVEIHYADFVLGKSKSVSTKILTPINVRPPYLNVPELFLISKD